MPTSPQNAVGVKCRRNIPPGAPESSESAKRTQMTAQHIALPPSPCLRASVVTHRSRVIAPVFCVLLATASALVADTRPNILFAIADDWSWPHAGAYGDQVVKTPVFDRIAREGVVFTHAFCAAPSCTPSRGAILTGQAIHRLEAGGNLWSHLPARFDVYPDLLEKAGYVVGYTRKGWGPGDFKPGGRERNPAGPAFSDFQSFLETVPADRPFCFWFGSQDPHRTYEPGSGRASGMNPDDVQVPSFLPDHPIVRDDILDYYFEVQRFDRDVGEIIDRIAKAGRLDNTLIVMTSDNGMPFPRAKANLYDSGTRMPLAIRWPAKIKPGQAVHDFVSSTDFAPTFLEAAGLNVPADVTGSSLLPLLVKGKTDGRARVFLERERHANVRDGDLSYPSRAIRTREYLYIRNFRPDRWSAGDPEMYLSVGPFGDIDNSPSKEVVLTRRGEPKFALYFDLACAKRPAEELYDLEKDPAQLDNVADQPQYADVKPKLRAELDRWMAETADPRATADDDRYDRYPYYGEQRERRARRRENADPASR